MADVPFYSGCRPTGANFGKIPNPILVCTMFCVWPILYIPGLSGVSIVKPVIRNTSRCKKVIFNGAKQNKLDYAPRGFSRIYMAQQCIRKIQPIRFRETKVNFFGNKYRGAIGAGAEMIYIAMFDEVDEGTAIFKVSKIHPPVGESPFVSFEEDIPSDYYLYLAGYAGRMLRKEIPFQEKIPAPKK